METNSNILSSDCCFLFEKCARETASLGASGHVDSHLVEVVGPFFEAIFGTAFYGQLCRVEPQMKFDKLPKTNLETESEQHDKKCQH